MRVTWINQPKKGQLACNTIQPEAYIEGAYAHENGIPNSDCPHHRKYYGPQKPVSTKPTDRKLWFDGWYDSYFHKKYPHLFPYPVTEQ